MYLKKVRYEHPNGRENCTGYLHTWFDRSGQKEGDVVGVVEDEETGDFHTIPSHLMNAYR